MRPRRKKPKRNVRILENNENRIIGGFADKTPALALEDTFFWAPWVPYQVMVVSGIQGSNKSSFLQYMMAQASLGIAPDGSPLDCGPCSSLYYTLEDTLPVVRQRLESFGADLRRILLVEGYDVNGNIEPANYSNAQLIERDIQKIIRERGAAPKLIVIDTMSRWIEPDSTAIVSHVRMPINTLKRIQHKYKCAIILIHHSQGVVNKRSDCLAGSIALQQIPRCTLYVTKFNRDGEESRLLCPVKTSWSEEPPCFQFAVRRVPTEANRLDDMKIDIKGYTDLTTDGAISMQRYAIKSIRKQEAEATKDALEGVTLESNVIPFSRNKSKA